MHDLLLVLFLFFTWHTTQDIKSNEPILFDFEMWKLFFWWVSGSKQHKSKSEIEIETKL